MTERFKRVPFRDTSVRRPLLSRTHYDRLLAHRRALRTLPATGGGGIGDPCVALACLRKNGNLCERATRSVGQVIGSDANRLHLSANYSQPTEMTLQTRSARPVVPSHNVEGSHLSRVRLCDQRAQLCTCWPEAVKDHKAGDYRQREGHDVREDEPPRSPLHGPTPNCRHPTRGDERWYQRSTLPGRHARKHASSVVTRSKCASADGSTFCLAPSARSRARRRSKRVPFSVPAIQHGEGALHRHESTRASILRTSPRHRPSSARLPMGSALAAWLSVRRCE